MSISQADFEIMQRRLAAGMKNRAEPPAVAIALDKIVSQVLAEESLGPGVMDFTVAGPPMGKPRMTQRDVWAKRPVVLRYREYCDRLRAAAPAFPKEPPAVLDLEFHLGMPKSWSGKKKAEQAGKPHRQRPDCDNLIKCIPDALFKEDSTIWKVRAVKYWAAPGQERTVVRVQFA